MGTLCQYCKVLEIDDAAWGGLRDESVPGKNVAAFSGGTVYTVEDSHHLTKKHRKKYPGSYGPMTIQSFRCQYGREDTFPELPDLKESAAECGFCALLRNWIRWQSCKEPYRFDDPERRIVIRSIEYRWHEVIGKNGIPLRTFEGLIVNATEADDEDDLFYEGADIMIYAPEGPCATWLTIPEETEESLKTPDSWEKKISMIKSSLWQCSEECGHSKFSDFVPSRLIYVGEKTEDPRLVVSSDPEHLREDYTKNNMEYAVLSYCWGESTSDTLTTTMDNFAAHLRKIPLAKMPATCRDAVLVTRALGLKWLWIDAFCIIQGNTADWHTESAEMAGVYGNAFVTIIPLRSLSSHDGFLDQLKKPAEVRVPFKSSIDPSVEGYYTLRVLPDEWDVHETLEYELFSSKWRSRGWTYQEDTMSLRKLYFGETDIYFRCGSQRTITCQSTATKPSVLDGESWPPAERRRTKIGWYGSLRYFSARDLTFKTDVFPAVSAIAKMHCNGVQEDYYCGMWISDLHNGLLWRSKYRKSGPEEHIKKLTSQNDYVAPSWSWASGHSMGYTVHYDIYPGSMEESALRPQRETPLWKILETEARLADASNPFGPVLSGHILVQGRWCSLSSLRIDYSDGLVYKGKKQYGRCSFDWAGDVNYWSDGREALPASYKERLVVLMVSECAGILLIPSVGNETWYRVGTYQIYSTGGASRANKAEVDEIFRISEERVFKIV